MPLATLRLFGANLPVGGGGYFRLLPRFLLEMGLRQLMALPMTASVVYFHPWEFDPAQPRLPLTHVSRFRTYVGIGHNRARFDALLAQHSFCRLIDVVDQLEADNVESPRFALSERQLEKSALDGFSK